MKIGLNKFLLYNITMDTILDNIPIDMFVSDIEENKPVEQPIEKPKKKRKPVEKTVEPPIENPVEKPKKREIHRYESITRRQLHGDEDPTGLMIIDPLTRIIM